MRLPSRPRILLYRYLPAVGPGKGPVSVRDGHTRFCAAVVIVYMLPGSDGVSIVCFYNQRRLEDIFCFFSGVGGDTYFCAAYPNMYQETDSQ